MKELKANDFVGHYKILDRMGEGGMAFIYKALQPTLKRPVVIKQLKDPNREIIRRFKHEALVSASFHHENLVAIYDFIQSGRNYFLVMEHVDGEDLRTVMDHLQPIPARISAAITMDVASGLEYTHARGIIHRDIKPGNILVSHDGNVKLIDFGVARDDGSTRLTVTGMIVGTPAYMAPEQANDNPLSPQSDVFSLGILLYEMLTGVKPFQGENNTEILTRIIQSNYIPPQRINPTIPWRMRRIVRKALYLNLNRRYRNATELIHDLERSIPWQWRSRKKEMLTRFMQRLDKTQPTSASDSLSLAMYSNRQSYAWRTVKSAFLLMTSAVLFFLYQPFSRHKICHVSIAGGAPNHVIRLDNRQVDFKGPNSTLSGPIKPGPHSLELRETESDNVFMAFFNAQGGDTLTIRPAFETVDRPARLKIVSHPTDATVQIDGKTVGNTPLNALNLKSGRHRIRLRKPGFKALEQTIKLDWGGTYRLSFTLRPQP